MIELNQCPYCGSMAELHKKGKRGKYKYKYECSNCWTQTSWCWTVTEAMTLWNKIKRVEVVTDE